jgi:hypothetical protein
VCVDKKCSTKTLKTNNSWRKCDFLNLNALAYVVLAYKTGRDRTKDAKTPAKIDLLEPIIICKIWGVQKRHKKTQTKQCFHIYVDAT